MTLVDEVEPNNEIGNAQSIAVYPTYVAGRLGGEGPGGAACEHALRPKRAGRKLRVFAEQAFGRIDAG